MKDASSRPRTRAVNPFDRRGFVEDVNEVECNLLEAVRTGNWPRTSFDDPDFIADWLDPKVGGGTLATLKREQRLYLETEERVFRALEAILAGRAHRGTRKRQAAAGSEEEEKNEPATA